jgi:hypothetical protein
VCTLVITHSALINLVSISQVVFHDQKWR